MATIPAPCRASRRCFEVFQRNLKPGGPPCATATFFLALTLCTLSLLTACRTADLTPRLQRFQYTSPHMGTTFSITLYAERKSQASEAARNAFARVAALEDVLSDYMADSELKQLTENHAGRPVVVSTDLFAVLQHGAEISDITGGAFDLTAGPYTRLWRFSRKRGTLPPPQDLAAARAAVGWQKLVLNNPRRTATLAMDGLRLDAGGLAKGHAADEAMKVLRAHGIDRALIAASGDILASQPPPGEEGWTVSIAGTGSESSRPHFSGWVGSGQGLGTDSHSREGSSAVGLSFAGTAGPISGATPPPILSIRNAALSTSGDTGQFIEIEGTHYSHIVSPFTGLGLTNRVQATVIAPRAATSDALATACCVLGPERAIRLADSIPGVSVLLIVKDGDAAEVWRSRDAP